MVQVSGTRTWSKYYVNKIIDILGLSTSTYYNVTTVLHLSQILFIYTYTYGK